MKDELRDHQKPKTHAELQEKKQRVELIEELYRRYSSSSYQKGIFGGKFRFLWKKYAWIAVVGGAKLFKRTADALLALIALIMLSPLFFFVAIFIKLTDGGPILFWQKRVGKYGGEFDFPKFRSMVLNAEELKKKLMDENQHKEGVTFKIKKDPRVTWIGRFIRKFSIDELPQLWCVLKGEMSIVGPRPPLPSEIRLYTLEQRRRLDVIPGLTCIWQVSGRADIPFGKQVELDVQYIESHSLWLDIKLLFKTIPAVISGKGAY